MEQAEIELLVNELEARLDRLRVLYEQYFMGFERVEPHVPKKDVERRVAVLRKEQIRNTGLRFKFQMIVQRYTTYQTYWFRIARQIEFGTYKRDVMRANARFGVDPTREVAGDEAQVPAGERELAAAGGPSNAPRQNEITEEEMAELEDGSAFLEPLDVEDDPFASISVSASPAKVPVRPPVEKFPSTVRLALDDVGDPFEEVDPFPKPAASPSAPKVRIAPRPGAATSVPAPAILGIDDHRDTERKIPVAPRVVVSKRPAPLEAGSVPAPSPKISAAPASPATPAGPAAPSRAPAAPPAPAPSRPQVVGPPAATAATRSPQVGPATPAVSRLPAAAPPPPAASAQRPAPLIRQATAARAASVPPAVQAAVSASPSATPAVVRPPVVAPAAAVSVASRAAAAPVPLAAPAASRNVGDLTGDRFGQIYSKYVETRRGQNEPTHAITRDALAKQLAESTERLKQKHAGKAIDFEVVVKEGKTILRPVVK